MHFNVSKYRFKIPIFDREMNGNVGASVENSAKNPRDLKMPYSRPWNTFFNFCRQYTVTAYNWTIATILQYTPRAILVSNFIKFVSIRSNYYCLRSRLFYAWLPDDRYMFYKTFLLFQHHKSCFVCSYVSFTFNGR